MTYLLDTHALLALAWENHVHHRIASNWLDSIISFSTCPITQAGFVRISSNPAFGHGIEVSDAFRVLDSLLQDARHQFWADAIRSIIPLLFERL
jgi:uncharacterized protein